MKLILDDSGAWKRFAPLTLTRPVGDLRMGIFTNSERWKIAFPQAEIFFKTEDYLSKRFLNTASEALSVNATIIPSQALMLRIGTMNENEQIRSGEVVLATAGNGSIKSQWNEEVLIIDQRWHIYQKNDLALKQDFELITKNRTSKHISASNTIIGDKNLIFLEEGAKVEASIMNTQSGPIYIGKDAEIMEGCLVRGPLALSENSVLKLGTKIYGPTTLGPHCKVGGEVNNSIFQAFSNKGHDGFLGNSLIGEWCNLGADTNTSNLKNNYGLISTYSYEAGAEIETDIQFMGLCMGDHSKCGINTMFNTATVVGVSSNIFGAGFPNKFVPSFSWGGQDTVAFKFEKAIEYANNMMNRRGLKLSEEEIAILHYCNSNF